MSPTSSSDRRGEAGFTLASLIVILTIMMIVIAYTVPRQWSKVMERERDLQTIFVMKEYARAIQNFRTKSGTLPVSLKQIADARKPRFIRGNGELIDPLTGNFDWIPISATAQAGQPGGPIVGLPGGNNPPTPPGGPRPLPGSTLTPSGPGAMAGPFIGVRPNKKGPSFLALNGAESYEQWSYTVNDLQMEIDARRNGLMATK